jgi:hypothetical protein
MAKQKLDNLLNEEIQRRIDSNNENVEYLKFVRQRKAQRNRIIVITTALFCPILVYLGVHFFDFSLFDSVKSTLAIAVGFMGAIATAALKYLQPSESSGEGLKSPVGVGELKFYVDKRFNELKNFQANTSNPPSQFSEADKLKVIDSIQAKLESDALQEYMDGIKGLVSAGVRKESLDGHFKNITARLSREVENLAKRGNLNLILGILTTLIGLAVLGYSVFYSPESHSPQELAAYFIPRISLVVLIEVFAYFFLRLYKQSLAEIKYFQNEITNIEAKQLAVSIIESHKDASLIARVVESLSSTERNFTISKEQTTIDLEREKIASQNNSQLLDFATSLIGKKQA